VCKLHADLPELARTPPVCRVAIHPRWTGDAAPGFGCAQLLKRQKPPRSSPGRLLREITRKNRPIRDPPIECYRPGGGTAPRTSCHGAASL
jgi:hypothetical protein